MRLAHMEAVNALVDNTLLPKMFRARQSFPRPALDPKQIPQLLTQQLEASAAGRKITPGMSVAITAGSRQIANSAAILRCIAGFVRKSGGSPFLVPAMGSHAGATARGQQEMLAGLGITEASAGCPIRSSMETVRIGQNDEGVDVYMDRTAWEADAVIVFNRIKPHSGFRGTYESGLVKMMAVGLGKQYGAEVLHSKGITHLADNIYLFGKAVLERSRILLGVAVLENAYDETAQLHVLEADEILSKEPLLLKKAFAYMPRISVGSCDALIVEKLGKNYSGGGMDPNITGRFASPLFQGNFHAQRIGVLDLSEETHGNANGIGLADVICKRAFDKIDAATTYPNAITTTAHINVRIPMVMMNDRLTIQTCVKGCYDIDRQNPRVVLIKNTMDLEHIWLSQSYLAQAEAIDGLEVETAPAEISFDRDGSILRLP